MRLPLLVLVRLSGATPVITPLQLDPRRPALFAAGYSGTIASYTVRRGHLARGAVSPSHRSGRAISGLTDDAEARIV
jgi:hypothetical protein